MNKDYFCEYVDRKFSATFVAKFRLMVEVAHVDVRNGFSQKLTIKTVFQNLEICGKDFSFLHLFAKNALTAFSLCNALCCVSERL